MAWNREEELETCVFSNSFYRFDTTPGSVKQLLRIEDEPDVRSPPSHLTTLPTGLTDSELGYLLIFDAYKARVCLDREMNGYEEYPVRILGVETSGNVNTEKVSWYNPYRYKIPSADQR
jgi:hypothetical protein